MIGRISCPMPRCDFYWDVPAILEASSITEPFQTVFDALFPGKRMDVARVQEMNRVTQALSRHLMDDHRAADYYVEIMRLRDGIEAGLEKNELLEPKLPWKPLLKEFPEPNTREDVPF